MPYEKKLRLPPIQLKPEPLLEPISPELLELILRDIDINNPTASVLGISDDPACIDHSLKESVLNNLVEGDLLSWSAFEVIMSAIISANPSKQSHEARLKKAMSALLGTNFSGRSVDDDSAVLLALMLKLWSEEKLIENPIVTKEEIQDVLAPNAFEEHDDEKVKAFVKRIRRKFKAQYAKIHADFLMSSHPKQRERWKKTQQVIQLITELGIIPN